MRIGTVEPFARLPQSVLASASPRAIQIYGLLAAHRNRDTGRCDPSLERLAAEARCSESTVRRAVRELVALGCVEKQAGHGARRATNRYRLPYEQRERANPHGSSQPGIDGRPNRAPVTAKPKEENQTKGLSQSQKQSQKREADRRKTAPVVAPGNHNDQDQPVKLGEASWFAEQLAKVGVVVEP